MTNVEKFRQAEAQKLAEAIARHPEEYCYGPDKLQGVVDKMVPSLAEGRAHLGPATKAAARACGIKPTQRAIREYLSAKEA